MSRVLAIARAGRPVGTGQQRADRRWPRETGAQARVKRCGKSAPASRATSAARQPPPGARSNRGRAGPATSPQVDSTDGWSPPRRPQGNRGTEERKSVVEGKSVSVRVDSGGRRIIKKKK